MPPNSKALTMYRQFPGVITKIKQKLQNNWSHDPRVVCVVSPQKPPYFTIFFCLLFQRHLSIIIILNVTSGCNAKQSRLFRSQIRFSIVGEHITCRWSKLTNSLGRTKFLNFRLPRDQVVPLETAANLCQPASSKQAIFRRFFSNFELGDITKHSMTGSVGNCEFCFLRPQCSPRLRSGEH